MFVPLSLMLLVQYKNTWHSSFTLLPSHVILLLGHCNEVPVVDLSTSKVTATNQQSKKKTTTNLDASNCRYPLRSKQLIEGKFEKGDVEGICFSNSFFLRFIMLNYVMMDVIFSLSFLQTTAMKYQWWIRVIIDIMKRKLVPV